jgi:hypothetical protein
MACMSADIVSGVSHRDLDTSSNISVYASRPNATLSYPGPPVCIILTVAVTARCLG